MNKLQILLIVFLISLSIFAFANMRVKAQYATPVPLGRAASFSVLAGSAITNTGSTTVTGDVGISPGLASSVTGSPLTINDGTLYYGNDATAQNAQTDLLTAYNYAAGQAYTENVIADLGGQALTPGVYNSTISDSSLGLTGTLTLNGENNPDSVFIFQARSTLTTASDSVVSLINGTQTCNVFWQVGSSATIGSNSTFAGNILALTSITVNTGATVDGRVLALHGAVTLDNNTIGLPTITLTLATGQVGDTVTLSGSGFAADSAFSATFAGSTVTLSGTTTTDRSGNIPSGVTFTVPASTDGGQTVVVTDASSNSASATYTVTPHDQHLVTFSSSGLEGDATGNLVTFSVTGGSYSGATSPISVSGGSIWVDSGASVTYSFVNPVTSSVTGKQYRLDGVSGSASPFTVSDTGTVTGTYGTQYLVTFTQTGISSSAGSNTVLTVGTTDYAYNALPSDVWVDSGTTFSWASPVAGATGEQFVLTNDNGGLVSPIVAPGTDVATYGTQYLVTFTQTGISSSAGSNTVLTVGTTDYAYNALPSDVWVDSGTTFSWASPVAGATGEQFAYTGDSGLTSPITASGTDAATYKTQYDLKFGESGLDGTAQGTIVSATIGASPVVNVVQSDFPKDFGYVDAGTTITYVFTSTVTSSNTDEQFVLTTPAATPASGFSLSGASTVTGTYKIRYYLTMSANFGSTGPVSGWCDAGTVVSIEAYSPSVNAGEQYVWNGWTGSGTISYTGMTNQTSVTMNSAVSEAASWIHQFSITVDNSGHGVPTEASQWVNAGSSFSTSVTSPADVVSNVSQWVTSQPTLSITDVESAQTLTFSWTEQFYITVSTNFGGVSPASGWYNAGTVVPVSATAPSVVSGEQYVWNGWTGSGTGGYTGLDNPTTGSEVTMSGPITETASWAHQFYITVDANGHGSPTEFSQWVPAGSDFSVSVTAPAVIDATHQWNLTGLVVDSVPTTLSDSVSFTGVDAAHSVEFDWTENFYMTVVSAHGEPTEFSQWVNAGSSFSVSVASPDVVTPGADQWVVSGPSTQTLTDVESVHTVTFSWTEQFYITVDNGGHGTPSEDSQWVNAGSPFSTSVTSPADVVSDVSQWVTSQSTLSITDVESAQTLTFSWTEQYYLTVSSANGSPSGQGWYNVGATANAGLASGTVSGSAGTQYVFTGWSGDASGTDYSSSVAITMSGPKTATANWKTQYELSFHVTGLDSDASSNTVLTVGSTNYVYSDFPVDNIWVDSGTTFSWSSPVSGGSGERFVLTSDNSGLTSPIEASGTDTATYKTQYKVTFTASANVLGDSSATIVTVGGSGETLPFTTGWLDSGSSLTYSFASPVTSSSSPSNTQYRWGSTSGLNQTLQSNTFTASVAGTVTGTYVTQYYLTVSSVYGTTMGAGWYDVGSTVTVSATGPSVGAGERYVWNGWTGSGTGGYTGLDNPTTGSEVTMSGPITETASWTHQYYLTVENGGHGTAGGQDWYDAGATAYATISPLTVAGTTGTQYVFAGWSGDATGLSSPSNNILMSGPMTATATWTTQHYLTVASAHDTAGGQGWYESGSTAYAILTDGTVAGTTGTQYVFTGWSGDASGTGLTSNAITMSGPMTATASWKTQYKVTFAQSGLTSDASGTVVTVAGGTKVYTDLPFTTGWVDSGSSLSWSFSSPAASTASPASTQYRWGSTSGLSQSGQSGSLTVTAPGTVTGTYVIQYKVSFDASSNVKGDSSGTIVTVGGSAKAAGVLPFTTDWIDSGATVTWAFASPVASSLDASGTQYSWTSTSGLGQSDQSGTLTVSAAGTITGTYTTQYKVTASYSTSDSSIPSASVTLSGTAVGSPSSTTLTTAPQTVWLDSGTGWSVNNPITSGTQRWDAASGASGTVTGAVTIAPSYYHQYQVTFVVSPSGTGSTSPAGANVWEDAGSLGISATANSGYLFSTWSSNTGSITFNSANSASTTATISGSGIITSNFVPATINLPAVDHFVFSAVVSQTAGTSFIVTITAVDSSGNTVTSYSGTNTLGVSTGTISPTSTGAFSNGVWSGSVTLTGAGSGVTLSTSGSGQSGTSNSFTVTHASAVSIAVSPATATVTAGGAETYTATASDSFGNTWTVSAVWSIGSGAGGSWSSNVYTSELAGTWTVTGTYLSLSYTASLMVDPGAATQLAVSSGASQVAGTAFSVTVTAEDAYGNTATGYTDTVHFSSSDSGSVSLPSDYTFLSGDLGTHTFTNGVTLVTAGTGVSVTATDTVTSSITGSQTGITVAHAAAASSVAIAPANSAVTAGGAETYSATATDAYGNTWNVTSSTSWRISSGAGGSWLDNVYTSAKAGSWTVTGTYNSAPYTTGLTVNPAVLDHFVFNTVATQTAGSVFSITVTAKDAYGNTVTSYTGTPSLSYSAGSISPSTIGAFVNGVGTTTVTVTAAGSGATITATAGSHAGTSNSFTVNPTITASAGANGTISPTGSVSVNYGDNQSFTITANTGYHIADVVVDSVSQGAVSSYTFTNVQAAHAVSATFAINTHAITPSVSGGHGTISPDTVQTVNYGDMPSFAFTPDTGYHILGVQVDGVSVLGDVSGGVYTFGAVSVNHAIVVAFAIDTHTITASAGVNGGISPSGSVSVNYGSDQSFTITANTGYHIADVVVDSVSQGAVSSYTFTNVQAAHTINASFAINIYTTTTIIGIESNTTIVPITLEGNITAQQVLTNVTITPNPLTTTTTLSFTITGPSGTVGFGNMTLPKTAIPYGTTPVVYIDGQQAPNQGYTQDANNFYVWYTTHFSTHQVTILFTVPPATSLGLVLAILITIAAIILIFIAIAIKRLRARPR